MEKPPVRLRDVVRDVLRGTDLVDPQDIADEVLRRIKPADQKAALRQALLAFVRQVNSETRTAVAIVDPSTQAVLVRRNMKLEARSMRAQALRDRYHVPNVGMKMLADMTGPDLLAAADYRDEQARRNEAKARQLRVLAGVLTDHGVTKVSDLPVEVQDRCFEAAA